MDGVTIHGLEDQVFSFGNFEFKDAVKHSDGDVNYTIGCTYFGVQR